MTREEFLNEFPALVKIYQPAADVLAKIGGVELLMIIGPSGVGKTTIIEHLDMPFIPSCTTRDPRPDEAEGKDFFFLRDYQQVFDDIESGRYVQVAVGPSGDFYASLASSYPATGLATMPVLSDAVPLFRNLGFKKTISVFIVPPDYEEWMRRMGAHHLTEQQLKGRLSEAQRSLSFALNDPQVQLILNDNLDTASRQINDMLNGKIDETRVREARLIAQELLRRVS